MEGIQGVRKETAAYVIAMRTVRLHVAKCSGNLCKFLDLIGLLLSHSGGINEG
jgi:hypothetical protein